MTCDGCHCFQGGPPERPWGPMEGDPEWLTKWGKIHFKGCPHYVKSIENSDDRG